MLIERLLRVGRGPRETFEGSHGAAPLYLKNSFEWYTDWGPLQIDKRFDALEQQMERSFFDIKRMFQRMTEHAVKSDELREDHEQRLQKLEVAA